MEFHFNDRYIFPLSQNVEIPKIEKVNTAYHYTGLSGFKAILENKTLRFTSVACLNDAAEVIDGVNEFNAYMKNNNAESLEDGKKSIAFHENNRQSVVSLIPNNIFVFCASTDYDNLAMWRYYTKDPKSISGFNLELAYDKLINSLLRLNYLVLKNAGISYGLAIYEKDVKRKIINNGVQKLCQSIETDLTPLILSIAEEYVKKAPSPEKEKVLKQLKLDIEESNKESLEDNCQNTWEYKTNIFKLKQENEFDAHFDMVTDFVACSFSKNRTFSYEKEFRIAIVFTDEQLLRLKADGIIKETEDQGFIKTFLELSFDINSVVGITSAPLMKKSDIDEGDKTKNGIAELKDVEIKTSASSVRF